MTHQSIDHQDQGKLNWMGLRTAKGIAEGDNEILLRGLLFLARHWMALGGVPFLRRDMVSLSEIVLTNPAELQPKTAEQRTFLAAGCDLYDVLTHSPQGREALLHLGLEPVLEKPKSE